MVTFQLKGRITESGELDVQLPKGIPAGEVQVEVTIDTPAEELPWELRPWTDEELAELLKTEPKTGAEIVAEIQAGLIGDGWSDVTITGAEWVEEQRRKQKERLKW